MKRLCFYINLLLKPNAELNSLHRSDADVVESYLRLKCYTGHPYAVEIPNGSSGHTKPSGDFRVAATRCADRGAERRKYRYSFNLLSSHSEIRHRRQEIAERLDFRVAQLTVNPTGAASSSLVILASIENYLLAI